LGGDGAAAAGATLSLGALAAAASFSVAMIREPNSATGRPTLSEPMCREPNSEGAGHVDKLVGRAPGNGPRIARVFDLLS